MFRAYTTEGYDKHEHKQDDSLEIGWQYQGNWMNTNLYSSLMYVRKHDARRKPKHGEYYSDGV